MTDEEPGQQVAELLASLDRCPIHGSMSVILSIVEEICQKQEDPARQIAALYDIIGALTDLICAHTDGDEHVPAAADVINTIINRLNNGANIQLHLSSNTFTMPGDGNDNIH